MQQCLGQFDHVLISFEGFFGSLRPPSYPSQQHHYPLWRQGFETLAAVAAFGAVAARV